MSVLTPVLYGNRLFGRATYSENQDPQTFNLSFSETLSSSDMELNNTTKVLSDLLTSMDAIAANTNKPLSETVTMTETFVKTANKVLAETLGSSDTNILLITKPLAEAVSLSESFLKALHKPLADTLTLTDTFTKVLAHMLADLVTLTDSIAVRVNITLHEYLLVQDWTSIQLQKPQQWTVAIAAPAPYMSLYGRVLFGRNLYSGLSGTTWIAIKPPTPSVNGWKSYNQLESMD